MHVAIDIDQTIYACGFAAEGEDISHALGNVKRKINETIIINDDIELTVVEIRGKSVKLGVNFPSTASVYRREVWELVPSGKHGRHYQHSQPPPRVAAKALDTPLLAGYPYLRRRPGVGAVAQLGER